MGMIQNHGPDPPKYLGGPEWKKEQWDLIFSKFWGDLQLWGDLYHQHKSGGFFMSLSFGLTSCLH